METESVHHAKLPIYALTLVLAVATVVTAGYLYHEKQQNQDLAVTNQSLGASLVQLKSELQLVKDQITAQPPARATTVQEKQPQSAKPRPEKSTRAKAQPPKDDPRFGKLQGQLSDQEKLLASTREDLDKTRGDLGQTRDDLGKTRDDLQGNIDSTRGELSGSIARTHDELVSLQKRGERNYYEFQLNKGKAFERVGPLRVSLRKADLKHKRFDVNLMVDDNELQKKSVNLYETVWLNLSDRPQPVELVVNQITKDHIAGYLSEPKYKKSELDQATNSSGAPVDAKASQ
jgi:hypothetical protein